MMARLKTMKCLGWFGLLWLLWVGPAVATNDHAHHHGGGTHRAAVCLKPGTQPSLRCALAPTATFDHRGRLWLVWVQGGHVYVNHSDDRGRLFSAPVRINARPERIGARGELRPKIAVAANGHIYISYTQLLKKRFSGHVRFSRSVNGGRSFSTPITINSDRQLTSHRFDVLGVNAQGHVYIAWLDKRDMLAAKKRRRPYRGAALYFALSTDGGQSFHANKKIRDHSCQCCRLALAFDTDDLPVMVWRHIFDRNTRDHALVKFKTASRPGTVRRASDDQWQVDGCPHHGPALAIGSVGRYHLTWFTQGKKRQGLFYAHSSDQGRTFSTPMPIGDANAQAGHPTVLALGAQVFLAWKEFTGKVVRIRLRFSPDRGRHWLPPYTIAETAGPADYPFLLTDGKRTYLSWRTKREGYRLLTIGKPETKP